MLKHNQCCYESTELVIQALMLILDLLTLLTQSIHTEVLMVFLFLCKNLLLL